MRTLRLSGSALLATSTMLLAACGDDGETSSGGGGATSATTSTTGVTTASSTSTSSGEGGDTGSGGDASGGAGSGGAGSGGAGSGGAGSGGAGSGGSDLEVIEGPGFRSGSRLRPVFLDGGDGARQLLHWYDAELGLPCRFSEDNAAGDRYSCLPIANAEARIVFTDEACTEPVMLISEGACGDRFATAQTDLEVVRADTDELQARGTRTVFERGDELAPQPPVYRRTYAGCEALALESGQRVHAADAPNLPLVSATREIEPLGEGLARAVANADDGSMQLMGPFHGDSATPCQYLLNRTTEDGASTCTPAVAAEFASPETYFGLIHYADVTCSNPAASLFTGNLIPTLGDYVIGPSEAQGEVIAYERGEELVVAYSMHSGECAQHATSIRHYAVGARLDRTFPHVFYFDVPGGRLASHCDGSASGDIASSAYGFSDVSFDDGCQPYVLEAENEDGAAPLRCIAGTRLPANGFPFPSEGDYFADPDCTDALVEFRGGVAYQLFTIAEPACSALPARDEVTKAVLFEPYPGDVYERWRDACRPYSGNGYPQDFSRRVRELGPDDFAIVTLVNPSLDAP